MSILRTLYYYLCIKLFLLLDFLKLEKVAEWFADLSGLRRALLEILEIQQGGLESSASLSDLSDGGVEATTSAARR